MSGRSAWWSWAKGGQTSRWVRTTCRGTVDVRAQTPRLQPRRPRGLHTHLGLHLKRLAGSSHRVSVLRARWGCAVGGGEGGWESGLVHSHAGTQPGGLLTSLRRLALLSACAGALATTHHLGIGQRGNARHANVEGDNTRSHPRRQAALVIITHLGCPANSSRMPCFHSPQPWEWYTCSADGASCAMWRARSLPAGWVLSHAGGSFRLWAVSLLNTRGAHPGS
jgi:hypothetical protein